MTSFAESKDLMSTSSLSMCLCRWAAAAAVLLIFSAGASPLSAEDLVEFLNGAKARGKVLEIRKADQEFDFEVSLGGRTYKRTYPYAQVHAVTMGGKRYVFNEKPAATAAPDGVDRGRESARSSAEIERIIQEQGSTPPDWFSATPLDYPQTLDLSWPVKAPEGGWNNQKNVGQYFWDIINPNTNRWRSGVRLLHHLLTLHKDDPNRLQRDMQKLGTTYFELFQDYPRAAFWLRKAGVTSGSMDGVLLAECYWRLGNKQMAMEMLRSRTLHPHAIKLLGDMGETARALQLATAYAKTNPHEAYLLAGDAARLAGQYDQAISYYEKVLAAAPARNEEYDKLYAARAQESIDAIRLFEQADVSRVADGSYTGTSTGYNGAMEIEVTVASGRIESVEVTRHEEKQFYSALTDTPAQIISKQSVTGIDATSRATITSQAVVHGAAKALAQGRKQAGQ